TMLPVLAVWLFLFVRRQPKPWTFGQMALGATAALLIGVFVPMNLVARVLPIGWLVNLTGNAHNALFVDQIGSAIGAYEFFGLPGLGLLLAWLLLARLERQSARAPRPFDPQSARPPSTLESQSAHPLTTLESQSARPRLTP